VGATDHDISIENVASYSARGPTGDGRTKPDLVFPGTSVRSAQSSGDPTDQVNSSSQCASGASAVSKSGTSMSAPGVAGLAVLARQYVLEYDPASGRRRPGGALTDGKGPSAAIIKAILINSARSVSGYYGNSLSNLVTDAPNPAWVQGYGRPNLDAVLKFEDDDNDGRYLFLADRYQLETGDNHSFEFFVAKDGELKATLVWTDPPGPGNYLSDGSLAPQLINDLDLVLSCSGCTPRLMYSASRLDNVEQVPPGNGLFPVKANQMVTIVVKGFSISVGPQPYSLVVSGEHFYDTATPVPNFVPQWNSKAVVSTPGVRNLILIIVGSVTAFILVVAVVVVTIYLVRGRTDRSRTNSAEPVVGISTTDNPLSGSLGPQNETDPTQTLADRAAQSAT